LTEKILITGAAGFIGYNLAKSMLTRGYEVIAIDNLSRGSKKKIERLKEAGCNTHIADIRDIEKISMILRKTRPSFIVHLAALISVEESFTSPEEYFDVNVIGTLKLLKLIYKYRVNRIVYISSAAVYGNPIDLPIKESHPTSPLSPYGLTKLAGEHLTRILSSKLEIEFVILRLFNVYGPGQSPLNSYSGVISRFIYNALRNQELVIFGDGNHTRDFIHVQDVVEAIKLSIKTKNINEIYNIGSGKRTTINELAKKILHIVGKGKIVYTKPREGDIKHSFADISKAKEKLGFRPTINIDEGITTLIENMKKEMSIGKEKV